jgi:hypothetical protein
VDQLHARAPHLAARLGAHAAARRGESPRVSCALERQARWTKNARRFSAGEKRPPFLRWTKNARRFSARHNPLNHARDRNNRITPTTPTNQRQIGAIALALPLLSYVSFQDDYRGMAPWSPGGFYRIARKTYGSMDARGRVSQKSL